LTFDELTIIQSNQNTSIKKGEDLLAIINNVNATLITENDFVLV